MTHVAGNSRLCERFLGESFGVLSGKSRCVYKSHFRIDFNEIYSVDVDCIKLIHNAKCSLILLYQYE